MYVGEKVDEAEVGYEWSYAESESKSPLGHCVVHVVVEIIMVLVKVWDI